MKTEAKIAERISNGLTGEQQTSVIETLLAVLSNQHVLYIKLRNFHWNLKGPRFHSLHELFGNQYETLATAIDETAERIRKIGGVAPGSMSEFLAATTLKEAAGEVIAGDDAITALVADHEAIIRTLREVARSTDEEQGDQATADFLIALLQQHEKDAWMLRSYRGDS